MLSHHLRFAWRGIRKSPAQTGISLLSLILGLTFFFLISFWVKDEWSYDSGFSDPQQIGRVETSITLNDGTTSSLAGVGWPVGRALAAEYPEIESLTYMRRWSPVILFNGARFYENAFYADSNFFRVFDYELAEGNAAAALHDPHCLVISDKLKKKYFGNTGSVIGKTLILSDTIPYKITGVFKNPATPSHLRFDMLGSFTSLTSTDPKGFQEEFSTGWFDVNVYNYVKIRRPATPATLTAKVKDLVLRDGKAAVEATGMKSTLLVRPVSDIYLYSGMSTGNTPTGNIANLRLFSLVGLFILIIACLNFVNLSTARSVERAREIGIKKVLGAGRGSLVVQFLGESAWLCLGAAILSMGALLLLLPAFNQLTGKSFTAASLFTASNTLLLLLILCLVIPISGLYPAWVLSSFQPVKVLKGRFAHSGSGNFLRKTLVIAQFTISIVLILSTGIIWKQLRFMQDQNLGFDKDKVVLISAGKLPWHVAQENWKAFRANLLALPGVSNVSSSWALPGRDGWNGQFAYPEGRTKDQGSSVEYIPVDANYIKTLGLKLVAGRDFFPESQEDRTNNVIINESAVTNFGWHSPEQAIGKKLSTSGKEGVVIGVLKNYHQHSLHDQIGPLVLGIGDVIESIAIRYDGRNPRQLVTNAAAAWNGYFHGYAFDYRFLDEDFQEQYKKDANFQRLFGIAAGLSIAIACLGLLGLAAYSTRTRLKEIGVRKVLGASAFRITGLLSGGTIRLEVIALVVASPVAWIGIERWLRQFAYKTTISWWLFPLAAVIAIGIALATIAFTTIKAAMTNPVTTLRSE
jgi:putative ABC transport system permease protein